jgi:hypothetical protein
MDLYICRDAPRSEDFDRCPRFAASAAPAAICCFFDFAGITIMFRACAGCWIRLNAHWFAPQKVNRHAGQHDQYSDSGSLRREKGKIDNE